MKIINYISAFALSALMCCCTGSKKEVAPVDDNSADSLEVSDANDEFEPEENQVVECYESKLSYAVCIDCDVLDQFRTMSIYGPENKRDKKMPVIMFIEGGASEVPTLEWPRIFVELGYKVCIPRCSNIKAVRNKDNTIKTFRTALCDVSDALTTMKAKADKYGIDTTNIFLAGDASGAHLIASYLYTYVPGAEQLSANGINGFISISTIQPLNLNEFERKLENKVEGLVFHGTAEKQYADIQNSKQLAGQLSGLVDYIEVEGANEFPTPEYVKVVKDSCRVFLKEHTAK